MTDSSFRPEVLAGLARPQKAISPKWLYDQRGSELFEDIVSVADYYPPEAEAVAFETAMPETGKIMPGAAIAEFGSGASMKIDRLIEAVKPCLYVPIDIAETFLKDAAASLSERFPDLPIEPVVGDFTRKVDLPEVFLKAERRLGFFPGSTIGNFDSGGSEAFLREARGTLGQGSAFLVSADLVKDKDILLRAYDDRDGVTRAFNLNLLTRINRELEADFDLGRFRHEARWNDEESRIEMHLVSALPQEVSVAGRRFTFAEGETIHTENSHKYTVPRFTALAERAGWTVENVWTDDRDWFGVFLLKA